MYDSWNDANNNKCTTQSFDNVLDRLSSFGPLFGCNGDDITILSTPNEFYETLLKQTRNAKKRILFSTLYIGQGEREKELVSNLTNQLSNNPDLQCSFIMDYSRSTRNMSEQSSSLDTLKPLLQLQNKQNDIDIHLFKTPLLSGLWNLFPERAKEVAGVHHIKAFITDDVVIISGANLNETYLKDRQDRYFVIENNANLANHLYSMMKAYSHNCASVQYCNDNDTFKITENENEFDYTNLNRYCLPENESKQPSDLSENDTYIVLGTQITDQITSDSQITSTILSIPNADVKISTAYFNIASAYNDILLKSYDSMLQSISKNENNNIKNNGSLEIITSSEKCNSFYNASGAAGYVTSLYSYFANAFQEKIAKVESKYAANVWKNRFRFHRYIRHKWTYHAKGIWIDFDDDCFGENPFTMTVVGSSNYGERSVNRDTEMNLTIITKNDTLRNALKCEWNDLVRYTDFGQKTQEQRENEEQSSSLTLWLMSGLVRAWM